MGGEEKKSFFEITDAVTKNLIHDGLSNKNDEYDKI